MKIVFTLLATALIISSGVMFFLVKKGAALRPAGVIAPSAYSSKPELIAESVALRLFPDFQSVKNVIWHIGTPEEPFASIPEVTLSKYQTNSKPELIDLRTSTEVTCAENCWYVQTEGSPLPEALAQKVKAEPSLEIYVQYFDRNEVVSEVCENEKILEFKCIGQVSVREVRKKFKTADSYFFMRRYLDSQFYLFIEKSK